MQQYENIQVPAEKNYMAKVDAISQFQSKSNHLVIWTVHGLRVFIMLKFKNPIKNQEGIVITIDEYESQGKFETKIPEISFEITIILYPFQEVSAETGQKNEETQEMFSVVEEHWKAIRKITENKKTIDGYLSQNDFFLISEEPNKISNVQAENEKNQWN